jgi:hypothetical protein
MPEGAALIGLPYHASHNLLQLPTAWPFSVAAQTVMLDATIRDGPRPAIISIIREVNHAL